MPGAFTPVCHKDHIPEIMNRIQEFRNRGVQRIGIMTTDSCDVITAWMIDRGLQKKILGEKYVIGISDNGRNWLPKVGLVRDGKRLRVTGERAVLVMQNGIVKGLQIDEASTCKLSSANDALNLIDAVNSGISFQAPESSAAPAVKAEIVDPTLSQRREEFDPRNESNDEENMNSESVENGVKRRKVDDSTVELDRGGESSHGTLKVGKRRAKRKNW